MFLYRSRVSYDDINFKLNVVNNSDLLVTIFKGKTEADKEAFMRIVNSLKDSKMVLLTCHVQAVR